VNTHSADVQAAPSIIAKVAGAGCSRHAIRQTSTPSSQGHCVTTASSPVAQCAASSNRGCPSITNWPGTQALTFCLGCHMPSGVVLDSLLSLQGKSCCYLPRKGVHSSAGDRKAWQLAAATTPVEWHAEAAFCNWSAFLILRVLYSAGLVFSRSCLARRNRPERLHPYNHACAGGSELHPVNTS
jgi:hypothetical protein